MADQINVPGFIPQSLKNAIVPTTVRSISQLASKFNLQNVRILKPQRQDFQIDQGTAPDPQLYLSTLGTPVLVDLTFHGETYIDETGNTFSFDDFIMVTVLITLSQTKNIVKTAIQGRKGTVKEYIGMGDYGVNIAGILTSTNGVYPRNDVQILKTILCAPIAITVTSWYLQMFDINSIVIDSYDIGQDEGGYSRQPFSISASSDEQVNLRFQ